MSGAFEGIDVAVVGGGISGLTAAFYLKKAGRRVSLLEAAPAFGGRVGTLRAAPYIADMGPQSFTASPAFLELVAELGLEARVLPAGRSGAKRYIYRHGRLNAVPASPFAFIVSPLLSAGAKWRLLAEPFVARREESGDESIASFVTRRAGRELVDAVIAPVISGIYAGDVETLSARSALPALVEFERGSGSVLRGVLRNRASARLENVPLQKLVGFAGGNDAIIAALAAKIAGSAYLNASVTAVHQRGAGFSLTCEGLPERTIEAGRLIVATPAGAAADLIAPLEPGAAEDLRGIAYPPVAQVVLAYPRSAVGVSIDGFGFLACRHEGVRLLGAIWNSALFEDRAPPDQVLVTAFLGGATDAAIAQLSDEEVARTAHHDCTRVMDIDLVTPKVVAGFRWANAIPQYALGHEERLARIAATIGRVPGLSLIGNYWHGPGVPACISAARAAAEAM